MHAFSGDLSLEADGFSDPSLRSQGTHRPAQDGKTRKIKRSFAYSATKHRYRLCTCPLRINTTGSLIDCHKSKKASMSGLSWPLSGPLTSGNALEACRVDT